MPTIEERIRSGIQYRAMRVEARKATDDSCIVEGYASTFNQPYVLWRYGDEEYREQVDPAAFKDCDMTDVIFQYNHEGRVFARTRNQTLQVSTDAVGLFIRADLGGTEAGRQLYQEIQGGYTDRMSFGFTVLDDSWAHFKETTDGKETHVYLRTITKVGKLYDVSAVSLPANDSTSISARSLVDGYRAKEAAEAAKAELRNKHIRKIKIFMEATKHGF